MPHFLLEQSLWSLSCNPFLPVHNSHVKSEDNFGKHWYAYPQLLESKSEHSLQKSDTLTFFHKIYSLWSLKFECCKNKMFLKSVVFRRYNGCVCILTQTNWNDWLLLYHIFLLKSNVGRIRILNSFNRELGLIGCFSMHSKVLLWRHLELSTGQRGSSVSSFDPINPLKIWQCQQFAIDQLYSVH